ncbi:hypothetical protein C8T65DRAFT_744706 [Cerioporus squamosus]|nr:hypothetical protein C8T65DRAFT_744706 [Cerioporus squamosus]
MHKEIRCVAIPGVSLQFSLAVVGAVGLYLPNRLTDREILWLLPSLMFWTEFGVTVIIFYRARDHERYRRLLSLATVFNLLCATASSILGALGVAFRWRSMFFQQYLLVQLLLVWSFFRIHSVVHNKWWERRDFSIPGVVDSDENSSRVSFQFGPRQTRDNVSRNSDPEAAISEPEDLEMDNLRKPRRNDLPKLNEPIFHFDVDTDGGRTRTQENRSHVEKLEANGATSSFAQDIRQEGKDVFNAYFQEDEFAPSVLAEYEPSSNTARISLYQKELLPDTQNEGANSNPKDRRLSEYVRKVLRRRNAVDESLQADLQRVSEDAEELLDQQQHKQSELNEVYDAALTTDRDIPSTPPVRPTVDIPPSPIHVATISTFPSPAVSAEDVDHAVSRFGDDESFVVVPL